MPSYIKGSYFDPKRPAQRESIIRNNAISVIISNKALNQATYLSVSEKNEVRGLLGEILVGLEYAQLEVLGLKPSPNNITPINRLNYPQVDDVREMTAQLIPRKVLLRDVQKRLGWNEGQIEKVRQFLISILDLEKFTQLEWL